MMNEVCYRTLKYDQPWSISNYKKEGGYSALEAILGKKKNPADIIEELKSSGLRGRGGAGFLTGLKWSFMPKEINGQRYIVCNSDESEPGTCKDRDILRYNPHQVIEGMIIAGYVLSASIGYNYMRGEFTEPLSRMEDALREAKELGYIGEDILGSGFDFQLHNVMGAGAYICGEETALIESLEGKKGMPRFKPPFPAVHGVYGKPTVINNTETIASIPVILQHGAKWFSDKGTEKSGGTKIFSVSGHVSKPGNYEVPLGTSFTELLDLAGGISEGKKLKAVIPGGSSVPVVPGDVMMKTNMDYESIAQVGSMLGAGSVIVMDDTTCMVSVLERISKFYFLESCGQCTPCREGTGWLYRVVKKIREGNGDAKDLETLDRVADNIMGNTICALGDAAAMPVKSFIQHYRDEFLALIKK